MVSCVCVCLILRYTSESTYTTCTSQWNSITWKVYPCHCFLIVHRMNILQLISPSQTQPFGFFLLWGFCKWGGCELHHAGILPHRCRQFFRAAVANLFGTRDPICGRHFSTDWSRGARDGFGMIQVLYIYCAPYFYCYYVVRYNEISIQLTIMHNQWEPLACFFCK